MHGAPPERGIMPNTLGQAALSRGDTPITRRGALALGGAAALAAAVTTAGCASGEEEGSTGSSATVASDGTQVIVAMNTESEPAAGFDPLVSWGCGEHVHEPLIQSTLITTDADLNFVCDLATDYACSPDGLVWTFDIRDDVVFSDGEPLTAADVAFTVNGAVASTAFEADLSMVDEAVATGDYTVELHLNKPYNALLYTLAVLGIVPEHAYGEGYGEAPVGSGRYLLERWDRGQQAVFVASPRYYGEAPLMERVVVVFMDEDAALAAVQAGEVDIAYTFATHAHQAFTGYELASYATVDSRGISLPVLPAGGTKVVEGDMAYPQGNDVTCDVAVRRAINCAIDRDAMIDEYVVDYAEYVGAGCGAYSFLDEHIFNNDSSVSGYIQRIESGHMSVASCIEMGRANWKRYRMGRELFGLRLDNRAWRRDFGKYIQYDMPIEYGYLAANGAFDKNNADELTLTRRGRYLVLVMMRQIFIGMNTERDRLRTQLPADERKMFSDSAERQIAAAQAADAE